MYIPLFSIIIPCYNQAQYLEEAVLSVIAQTYTNWECLIVNDGSPDTTEEIAIGLTKKDDRIIYLKKDNGGLADARNYGINKAKGKWILPLDADDKIEDLYLEKASQIINNNSNIDLIYCRASFFGDKEGEWNLINYNFSKMLGENQIFCSAIFKKSDWIEIGGYDTNMVFGFEDWEFWINMLKNKKHTIQKLDYIGFNYRIKKRSMTTDVGRNLKHIKMMHDHIYNKHEDVYYRYYGSFLDLVLKCTKLEEEKKVLVGKINKNYFTKILFRIIRLF